jgi:hypothetical protein
VQSTGGRARSRSFVAGVLLALVCAGTAAAADVGANDDTGKFAPDAGAAFYGEMASLGLRQTVVTVRWLPSDPLALGERPLLDLTVAAGARRGLSVVFATYPYPTREVEAGLARPEAFGAWLGELAHGIRPSGSSSSATSPTSRRSGGRSSRGQAALRPYVRPVPRAGYDALKAVDPTLTVVGVGLSPRGNDRPTAKSNVSTSPVRFLASLGAWYRASGRARPLMDGLSFHPYPNAATDTLDRGYPWPNAGFVNLARIKQAAWDAFAGTAQPTTVDGLRLYLDEVGWQVDTTGRTGYAGAENVAVTDEASQAVVYGELVRRAACDPDVAQVNVFGFRDDALRTGFQAGLFRADGSRPTLGRGRARRGCRGGVRDRERRRVAAVEDGARGKATGRQGHSHGDQDRRHCHRSGVCPRLPAARRAHALERPADARGSRCARRLHDGVRHPEPMGLGASAAPGRPGHRRRSARSGDESRAVDDGRTPDPVGPARRAGADHALP